MILSRITLPEGQILNMIVTCSSNC